MDEMIHLKEARKILDTKEPCSIKFWTASGEIVEDNKVVCTSSYYKNDTLNIKFLRSGETRKVQAFLIFEVNNKEIFL